MLDVCVGTSVGTITEPDCLGPCEPGTSVTLEGIVWHETEGGEWYLRGWAWSPHRLNETIPPRLQSFSTVLLLLLLLPVTLPHPPQFSTLLRQFPCIHYFCLLVPTFYVSSRHLVIMFYFLLLSVNSSPHTAFCSKWLSYVAWFTLSLFRIKKYQVSSWMTKQKVSVVYSLSLIEQPVGASEVCSYLPPHLFSGVHLPLCFYKVINTGPHTFVLRELLRMCGCPSRRNILVCVHLVDKQAMEDKCNRLWLISYGSSLRSVVCTYMHILCIYIAYS